MERFLRGSRRLYSANDSPHASRRAEVRTGHCLVRSDLISLRLRGVYASRPSRRDREAPGAGETRRVPRWTARIDQGRPRQWRASIYVWPHALFDGEGFAGRVEPARSAEVSRLEGLGGTAAGRRRGTQSQLSRSHRDGDPRARRDARQPRRALHPRHGQYLLAAVSRGGARRRGPDRGDRSRQPRSHGAQDPGADRSRALRRSRNCDGGAGPKARRKPWRPTRLGLVLHDDLNLRLGTGGERAGA